MPQCLRIANSTEQYRVIQSKKIKHIGNLASLGNFCRGQSEQSLDDPNGWRLRGNARYVAWSFQRLFGVSVLTSAVTWEGERPREP
jgi:hypothetical protein